MEHEVVAVGSTLEDALDEALEQLGVQQSSVEYEVLEDTAAEVKARVWIKPSELKAIEAGRALAESVIGDHEATDANHADTPELDDEQLDQVADTASAAIREITALLGIESHTVEEYEGDEGEIILDIVGGDLGLLIGRHGRTLDALQAAVGAITTRRLGFRYPVVVDVEGYRHRRRQKVEAVAQRAAARAIKSRQPVKLHPMTAYERRIVHVALRNDRRVTTTSEGAEPYRQVVVIPM